MLNQFFNKKVFVAGFAMFAMFFGSGNLVFPLLIGTEALDGVSFAMIGLLVTAVFVPFLGLFGMILYDGDREDYFSCLGKWPAFVLTLVMLSLMGPFGVAARCIIVAYGPVNLLYPELSFLPFSVVFSALTGLIVWKRRHIVGIIGSFLTPILLVGIAALILIGLWGANGVEVSDIENFEAFKLGLFKGYQTMDLLAAFFFSSTAIHYLQAQMKDSSVSSIERYGLGASFIGAGLLALIYIGSIFLGAEYAPQLEGVSPDKLLMVVASINIGKLAIPLVSIVFVMACLTTAAILVSLFAEFLSESVSKGKITRHPAALITLLITFSMSMLGFSGITVWLGALMEIVYPALIALALGNIWKKMTGYDISRLVFICVLTVAVAWEGYKLLGHA